MCKRVLSIDTFSSYVFINSLKNIDIAMSKLTE